jgi:hypothetical protein
LIRTVFVVPLSGAASKPASLTTAGEIDTGVAAPVLKRFLIFFPLNKLRRQPEVLLHFRKRMFEKNSFKD